MAYRMPMMQLKHRKDMIADNKLSEVVYNIDNVKYFQQEKREAETIQNKVQEVRNIDLEVVKSLVLLNSVQAIIISLGMVSGITMGVLDCYSGKVSPGDILMLQAIFSQIMQPLFFVGTLIKGVAETQVKLQFAVHTIRESRKLEENLLVNQLKEFENKGCHIKFKNVWFAYSGYHSIRKSLEKIEKEGQENSSGSDEEEQVSEKETQKGKKANNSHSNSLILRDFTVEFEKGKFSAIVGKSGQGKSTIFNLLYKLYLPNSGSITIDEQNLKDLDENSFRKHMTICPQNGTLFNESLMVNLKYGNPEIADEKVFEMTKKLGIFEKIISFDKGFETFAGTLGSKLSGGEKQRILLARALLKDSDIIILDEPTSNLDNNNELLVMDLLDSIKQDKTVIICSHKLNTLVKCDKLFVLNDGELVESGSHYELVSDSNSYYYDLYKNNYMIESE
eukprot:CAMPEP_0170514852 /NCGR_PEP_ID=MMETSP0209-20121228/1381_1 /TAXON_ID=665100 ORGANISM="Litonotus pictus, Strain P1" /NCGR_SAMPLE_ID=MMETSP0209 /ASSEMBLY_ACC=CAM_ASM_000301 /LENGTH=448 /DNA_ID=CAMNT_0010799097 /DNA_START=854 /DNA_END=2200 /DNA_ORIENTATION=+